MDNIPFSGLPPRGNRIVGWAVVLGIVIVLNIFYSVVVSYAWSQPEYNDFCPAEPMSPILTESACTSVGGTWQAYPQTVSNTAAPTGYCDTTSKCSAAWNAANDAYHFHAFLTLLVLGVLTILAGILFRGSTVISNGLSFGGVITLIIASGSYWSSAGPLWKIVISGVGLVALLLIGSRFFRDQS